LTRVPALVVVALVMAVSGCGTAHHDATLPDIAAAKCTTNVTLAEQPPTPAAIAEIASEERAPLTGVIDHSGHGQPGAQPPIDAKGPTGTALASEIQAAEQVACALRTPEDAARAGYVLSSNYTEGIGTHWTNWGLVDAPFDPTRPSMLLYGPRLGETQLVGFSYWVRTTDPGGPAGFAGSADRWHRHYGMCFDRAMLLEQENVRSPLLCNGTYLNGADMWMLHAWVVPGAANVWGLFAPLNPQLCRRSVADIARCPEVDAS
jgi:hypothetical protein